MTMTGGKAENSPFSNEGLNAGRARAFRVVAVAAAVSFVCAAAGVYVDFIRSPAITATFDLAEKTIGAGSLIDPQPPEKKAEKGASSENVDLIERLERAKENMEQTAGALKEMVEPEKTPEPAAALSPELQKLEREKQAAEQKKIDEIADLQKQRDSKDQRKQAVLNGLETALAAFDAAKPEKPAEKKDTADKKPPAAAPNLKLTEPAGSVAVPVSSFSGEPPPPDLIKTTLNNSLPDFSLIKKGFPANATPLHIIEPLADLQQASRYGKLPVKTKESTPFQAYRRPVEIPPQTPYVAVLFTGLGKRANATKAAINTLPATVSMAFTPYADKLKTYIANARRTGHETLLNLPMQQGVFPDTDPGPLGLVTGLPEQENRKRLHKVLGNDVAYIGVAAMAKENFSYSGAQMKSFYEEIIGRGLVYIDGTDDPRMPKFKKAARPDIHISENFYRAAIRAKLEQARQIALKKGSAFVRVETVPVTLVVVEEWMKSFAPTEDAPVPELTFVPLSYYLEQKEAGK